MTGIDTDGHGLAGIVRRVDLDEVARRMVAVFQSEIPAYRTLPDSVLRGEIEDISRRNLGLFFRSLVDDRPLSDESCARSRIRRAPVRRRGCRWRTCSTPTGSAAAWAGRR